MVGEYGRDDEQWRCWVDDMADSDPSILNDIQQWWDTTSPVPMVGSRHHTVPRRYLERFSASGQIRVRDRVTGRASLRSIKDVGAIRDFYTFINLDGERDGRLERIRGVIEDGATAVIDRILDPFRTPRPLTPEESLHLSIFIGFQLLRTPRHRREVELMGDYLIRSSRPDIRGITEVRVVPDPNLHLKYLAKNAPKVAEAFFGRPAMLVTIDQPLFITCDEPVVLRTHGDVSHVQHLPSGAKPQRRRKKDARKPSRSRARNADTVHVYPSRPGVAQAHEVALPLTPRALLVIGPPDGVDVAPHRLLRGEAAVALAKDVNSRLLTHAYQWVAAHPAHPTFTNMELPEPGPIVQACDGGTPFARELQQPPAPRQPELLGRRGR
ncbi:MULTISPECIES: DUF4238 domain-containing protein [Micromonospora]|uniref:DUF4238 domain-containing protein n=1 Tax=Micromonospora TaxID=1873 RepID=UPI00371D9041